jgi:hypothetical protein
MGGKVGYVERAGHLVNPAELERRRRANENDIEAIERRPRRDLSRGG